MQWKTFHPQAALLWHEVTQSTHEDNELTCVATRTSLKETFQLRPSGSVQSKFCKVVPNCQESRCPTLIVHGCLFVSEGIIFSMSKSPEQFSRTTLGLINLCWGWQTGSGATLEKSKRGRTQLLLIIINCKEKGLVLPDYVGEYIHCIQVEGEVVLCPLHPPKARVLH